METPKDVQLEDMRCCYPRIESKKAVDDASWSSLSRTTSVTKGHFHVGLYASIVERVIPRVNQSLSSWLFRVGVHLAHSDPLLEDVTQRSAKSHDENTGILG